MIGALDRALRHIGHLAIDWVWKLGVATRFTGYVLVRSADSVRRPQLTLNEIYFTGTLSLIIIVVSVWTGFGGNTLEIVHGIALVVGALTTVGTGLATTESTDHRVP